ncbi:MAG: kinase/pyrophosphorylase [Rhodospirillaceae bacterium]|nr:kinase/pyrophosphorylase [Rhodospirillaceae bacterium]
MSRKFHLHKVSDATGETLEVVARACLAQFPEAEPVEHAWPMVREENQIAEVLAGVKANPGFVIFTIVDDHLVEKLVHGCRQLQVPCIDLLNPVLAQLGNYLGTAQTARPGSQHVMDADYFSKIEALHYVLAHDDGKSVRDIEQADVVLFGVSRTSKTPTCIYLANHGLKAANIQITPGIPTPPEAIHAQRPLKIGLTKNPKRLVQIRRQRLELNGQHEETDYVDFDSVAEELLEAEALYDENGWDVIDVSRKSIEETAATIMQLHRQRLEQA